MKTERTIEEIMKGLHIYFALHSNKVYMVQDNYSHSLKLINATLEYAKQIGLTVPDDDEITIEILGGPRYKRVMSIEFTSKTKPNLPKNQENGGYWELTRNSGLWDWLVY